MKGLLFVYGLTYGGSVVALFRPYYGVLIYLAFACLKPEALWFWSVPAGNYSRTIAIATLIGWALAGFGDWKVGSARPILFSLLGYWAWIVVSALFAANQAVAWEYVILHSKILGPVVVGITLIHEVKQLKQIAWVIVACLGYLALEANRDYLAGGHQIRENGFASMDNNCFCIAMVTGASAAFFLGLQAAGWWRRLIALAAAALMAHVPLFANSRGGMLGMIVAGVLSFLVLPKRPAYIGAWLLALAVGIRLAGPEVLERFSTIFAAEGERDGSAQSRIDLWVDCWDVMQRYPITGAGPDHWPLLAAEYGWPKGKEAHSLWFNAGAELGFVGLAFLISVYGFTCWKCWQLSRDSRLDDDLRTVARMTIVAVGAYCTSASFVALDALEVPYYLVLLGAGAVALAERNASLDTTEELDERGSAHNDELAPVERGRQDGDGNDAGRYATSSLRP